MDKFLIEDYTDKDVSNGDKPGLEIVFGIDVLMEKIDEAHRKNKKIVVYELVSELIDWS